MTPDHLTNLAREIVKGIFDDGLAKITSIAGLREIETRIFAGLTEARTLQDDREAALSAQKDTTAEAAHSVSPQYSAWQPIETAPKDGKRILAWLGPYYDACILRWASDADAERDAWIDYDHFAPDPQPTHWMPLPALPSSLRPEAGRADVASGDSRLPQPAIYDPEQYPEGAAQADLFLANKKIATLEAQVRALTQQVEMKGRT